MEIVKLDDTWKGRKLEFRYLTDAWYEAVRSETPDGFGFTFEKHAFDAPVEKRFTDTLGGEWLENPVIFGALDNGELCGVIELSHEAWNNRLRVANLFVWEGRRRQGVGRQLMDRARLEAQARGARALVLETQSCNAPAIAFYRGYGFVPIGCDLTAYSDGDVQKREVRIELALAVPPFDADVWMTTLQEKLEDTFPGRLRFLGLQGSFRRGEATPTSDIDAVVVLDEVSFGDLERYRALLDGLPARERTCGFFCGVAELRGWPRTDLTQLYFDTRPLLGDLAGLAGPLTQEEVREGVRVGAGNLYHTVSHLYLHEGGDPEELRGAYKSVFYLLQSLVWLRDGVLCATKRTLLERLSGIERELLETSLSWDTRREARNGRPAEAFRLLLDWCQALLRGL